MSHVVPKPRDIQFILKSLILTKKDEWSRRSDINMLEIGKGNVMYFFQTIRI